MWNQASNRQTHTDCSLAPSNHRDSSVLHTYIQHSAPPPPPKTLSPFGSLPPACLIQLESLTSDDSDNYKCTARNDHADAI